MAIIDTMVGGVTSISSTGGTVTLNASQVANGTISVSGALSSSLTIFFPAVQGWWSIENLTTNNTSFFVSIVPTGGTQSVCAPPGEIVDIQINGTVAKYRNLGRIGSYMDIATATIPLWISNCTIAPYLICDGSTFSSGTYPQLAAQLGGTTLPDARGRARAALNQGTGRMLSANGGVDGNTLISGGGADTNTLTTSTMPVHAHGINDSGHTHQLPAQANDNTGSATAFLQSLSNHGARLTSDNSVTGISIQNSGGGNPHQNMQPTLVCGLTLIRAG